MTELSLNTRLPAASGAAPGGPFSHDLFWLSLLEELHALAEVQGLDAHWASLGPTGDAAWPERWQPLVVTWAARIGARSIQLSQPQGPASRMPLSRIHTELSASGHLEAHPPTSGATGPVIRAHSVSPDGFSPQQAREFHAFCSHFHTALALHTSLHAAQERVAELYRVIDALPVGIAMLDERLDLVLLNGPCQEWLARTERMEVRNRRLRVSAQPAALDLALRAFLADTSVAAQVLQLGGLDIQLTKLGPGETARPQWSDAQGLPAHVLMLIRERCDPVRVREIAPPPDVLARHVQPRYGLTDKELQLAWNLADGLSLKQVAGLTERSVETLRVQLKSIFRKLGTRDQSGIGAVLFEAMQAATLQSIGEHLAAVLTDRTSLKQQPAPSPAWHLPWR